MTSSWLKLLKTYPWAGYGWLEISGFLDGVRSFKSKVVLIQVDSIQTEVVSIHQQVDSIRVESRLDPS